MTSLSWTARNRRRGGLTQSEFLHEMKQAGFRICADSLPASPLLVFMHASTRDKRHAVRTGETFSIALFRMIADVHTTA